MRFQQHGFSVVGVLLLIVIICGVGFAGWRVYESKSKPIVPVVNVTSPPGSTARIVAVGDIVCDPQDSHASTADKDYCQDAKTANLIKQINPDALLLLGDLQYNNGTLENFQAVFDKNWGELKSISYPAPGNHEYGTDGASGYYTYFKDAAVDPSKGYYGFKLGGWKILSLNSNCKDIGGCAADSVQLKWLTSELTGLHESCSLAFWHHPRFTSGNYKDDAKSKSNSDTFWPALETRKVDLVLSGHDHIYERFAPQTASGQPKDVAPRQFTVGTGGKSHYKHTSTVANSEKIIDDQYGVLVLDLFPTEYRWEFKNIDSKTLDSGHQACV